MLRTLYIRPRHLLAVTGQARLQDLFLWHHGKSANLAFLSHTLHVLASRAVAPFATGRLRRFLARSNTPEMCVLVEIEPDVRMAPLAYCASNKWPLGRCSRLRLQREASRRQTERHQPKMRVLNRDHREPEPSFS